MYVMTYYLLGTYIGEHKPQPKRWLCGVVALGLVVLKWITGWAFFIVLAKACVIIIVIVVVGLLVVNIFGA